MGDIYFCATDYYLQGGYGSYRDWFRLAELSGFPVIPLSQLDPASDHTYIVTPLNGEWLAGWPGARARIIHYELEWRTDWRAEVNEPPGVDEVWAGDKWYAEQIGARYVPLGSHPGLNQAAYMDKKLVQAFDIAFMGYREPARRAALLRTLKECGLSIAPDGWGPARSGWLMQSTCMVAIHQHDHMPTVAPLRMCIAAAHGIPVISEAVRDAGMFEWLLLTSPYDKLADYIHMLIHDPYIQLKGYGELLYEQLCIHRPFRVSIEETL